MNTSGTTNGRRNAAIPALISCAVMVGVLFVLIWLDDAWSGPLIAAALLICFGLMALLGMGSQEPKPAGRQSGSVQSGGTPASGSDGERRADADSILAMLRSRRLAPDEQRPLTHVQFHVSGLTCAAEAAALAHKLREHDGVINATVNPLTERAYIDYEAELVDAPTLAAAITSAGYGTQ
jgi:copper chaperone CopZ